MEITTPNKKLDSTQTPPSVSKLQEQPQQQQQLPRRNSTGAIPSTGTTTITSMQPEDTRWEITKLASRLNPFGGKQTPVSTNSTNPSTPPSTQNLQTPPQTPTTPSNSNTNNTPNNSTSTSQTEQKQEQEKTKTTDQTPPVAQKKVDLQPTEEKPAVEIEPSVLQKTLGLGAFMTSRLVNVVGYKWLLVDGKLTLVKNNEPKAPDTTTKQ